MEKVAALNSADDIARKEKTKYKANKANNVHIDTVCRQVVNAMIDTIVCYDLGDIFGSCVSPTSA